jgi:monoterpene epsilon-lactone hydrolase
MTRPSTLPPRREGRPAPTELVETRASYPESLPFAMRTDVVRADEALGGVDCVIFAPDGYRTTILYFHGGGYCGGSPSISASYLSELAARTGARVVGVRYGLAPEQPFPNGLHDGLTVLRELARKGARNIIFAGDSAGGGLALSMALACRDTGEQMPSGLILLSPWIDLTLAGESYQSRAESDVLFSYEAATIAAGHYLQGSDPAHPYASPLHADLAGLPPVQLFIGGQEILLDEDLALAGKLARAGVTVEMHVAASAQHVWPMMFPDLPESQRALRAIATFVREAQTAPGGGAEI